MNTPKFDQAAGLRAALLKIQRFAANQEKSRTKGLQDHLQPKNPKKRVKKCRKK